MTITNYGTLKTAIADTLNRDDLASVLPQFVRLGHAQLNRRIRSHRQVARGALTLNARTEALPADWLETIRLTINTDPFRVLTQASMDDVSRYRASGADVAGEPVYFTHVGSEIELFPAPGESYTGEITYFASIPALVADADTNWLLTAHPDVYLYASLVHTAPYLKDDARLAVWAGLLAQGLGEIEEETSAARFGSPLRMRMR